MMKTTFTESQIVFALKQADKANGNVTHRSGLTEMAEHNAHKESPRSDAFAMLV
jgi:hypothetical protein